ncbi:MAG: hypothetical protein OCD01_01490 [Fibrobacterales bacterium]
MFFKQLVLLSLTLLLTQCAAPRYNSQSAKVTSKGDFKVGIDMSPNIPLNTIGVVTGEMKNAVGELDSDTNNVERDRLHDLSELVVAQSVDPISMGTGFYVRYGLFNGFDLGFTYAGGVKVYDMQYQFMGSTAGIGSETKDDMYGSFGLQYSSQDYDLPSIAGKVQSILGYEFSRYDILGRLVFGNSLGPDEKYGSINYGLAMNYTSLTYGFKRFGSVGIIKMAEDDSEESITKSLDPIPEQESGFVSYGPFVNVKAGYKHVFLVLSLSIYNQDYGEFAVLNNDTVEMDGVTIIPSFGLQVAF